MPSWIDIARSNYEAAETLARLGAAAPGLYRAAVNRYYYAGFHLITSELYRMGVASSFYLTRPTPGHKELPQLIETYFLHLSARKRQNLASAILRLYRRREAADYTNVEIDGQFAREVRRFLHQVFVESGVEL
jgi:hypothetical protein